MPSSRARVYVYEKSLIEKKVKYKIIPAISNLSCIRRINQDISSLFRIFYLFDILFHLLWFFLNIRFYDTVVIQKVVFPSPMLPLVKIFLKGKRVIFDVDDVVFLPHQSDDVQDLDKKNEKFRLNLNLYDDILVSSHHLGEMIISEFNISPYHIKTITDPIDTEKYNSKFQDRPKPVIGWIGTPSNTVYLEECLNNLVKLSNEGYEFSLFFTGADESRVREITGSSIPLYFGQWILEREPELYDELDIGLMPVPYDIWSRGKGGYKLMLYMSMSKITVAGAVGINKDIVEDGFNGVLVKENELWYDKLKYVLDNYSELEKMKERARQRIIDKYSLKKLSDEYVFFICNK